MHQVVVGPMHHELAVGMEPDTAQLLRAVCHTRAYEDTVLRARGDRRKRPYAYVLQMQMLQLPVRAETVAYWLRVRASCTTRTYLQWCVNAACV